MNYNSAASNNGGVEASDILGLNELENSDLLKTGANGGDEDFSFDLASKSALLFMASSSSSAAAPAKTNLNSSSSTAANQNGDQLDITLSSSNNLNNSNSNSSLNNKIITGIYS
jgi:hypothetical protein